MRAMSFGRQGNRARVLLASLLAMSIAAHAWAASGDLLWRKLILNTNNRVALASVDGRIITQARAFNVRAGSPRTIFPELRAHEVASGKLAWKARGRNGYVPGGVATADSWVVSVDYLPGAGQFDPEQAHVVKVLDARSGSEVWSFKLEDSRYDYSVGASASGNRIVVDVDRQRVSVADPKSEAMVLVFEAATGKPLWSDSFEGRTGEVLFGGGRAFVPEAVKRGSGTSRSAIRAYDLKSGALLWRERLRKNLVPQLRALHRGRLAVAGGSMMEVYDSRSGKRLWKQRIRGEAIRSMTVARRTVVVSTSEGRFPAHPRFRAYDLETGRSLWRVDAEEATTSAPRLTSSKGRVFAIDGLEPDGGVWLYSYRGRSGRVRWSRLIVDSDEDLGLAAIVHDGVLITEGEPYNIDVPVLRAFEP